MAEPHKALGAVKACAFDMFGTLFDVHSVVKRCRDAFGEDGDAFSEFWRDNQLKYSWLRALMNRYVPFWQVTCDSLDTALEVYGRAEDQALRQRLLDGYKEVSPYPEVADALDAIARTGVQRVILTNGSKDMMKSALAAAGITDKFDDLFSVEDVATFKPNPLVYQMAQAKLGLEKHEIMLVSSHPWDLAGAGSYGFQGIWIDRPGVGHHPIHVGYGPDHRVEDLNGVAEKLKQAQA